MLYKNNRLQVVFQLDRILLKNNLIFVPFYVQQILEELLEDYQNKNRILFIKEKKILSFHITVIRTYLWYEKRCLPLPSTRYTG